MTTPLDSPANRDGGRIHAAVQRDPSAHAPGRIPEERSLLWSPRKARARAGESATPYHAVLEQSALKQIREQLASVPDGEVGGVLLGRLFQCPETRRRWVRVESAVRVSEPLPEEARSGELGAVLGPAVLRARGSGDRPVGWYHGHRRLGVFLSESEARFHRETFGRPSDLAVIVLVDDSRPAGGVFLPLGNGELPRGECSPFYERLVDSSFLPDGRRRTFVGWQNYDAPGTIARAGLDGVSAAIPPDEIAPEPPASKPPATGSEEIVFARRLKQTLSAVDVTLGPTLPAPDVGEERETSAPEPGRLAPPVQWPRPRMRPVEPVDRQEPLIGSSRSSLLERLSTPFRAVEGALAHLPRWVRIWILVSTLAAIASGGGWLLWSSRVADDAAPPPGTPSAAEHTAQTTPSVAAFDSALEVFGQESVGYRRRREEFDRGLIGCNALTSRYRSVDEAFFRLSRGFVKARAELAADGLAAYQAAGTQMDEIDRHYDGTGCPRPR